MKTHTPIDHYKAITDTILALLDKGVKPWERPWEKVKGEVDFAMPHNVVTGRPYRGINVVMLWLQDYPTQQWLSFKQAKDLHGNVRKGEKATLVYFFKILELLDEKKGEDGVVKVPLLRAYPVFNVAQCDNLRLPQRATAPAPVKKDRSMLGVVGPVVDRLKLRGGLYHAGNSAYYTPSTDTIVTPKPAQFKTAEGFRATVLHECAHATGAEHRLERLTRASFASQDYAWEELVAELSAAMASVVLGIKSDVENHVSYIGHWRAKLKEDKYAFVRAASAAQRATDCMLGNPSSVVSDDLQEAA